MSYVSLFWLFASFKALQNRHWLLSLVTTTTFLLQVREYRLLYEAVSAAKICNTVTIVMSALFDLGNGVSISLSDIPQSLELRNVPLVRKMVIEVQESIWPLNASVSGWMEYLYAKKS
jgi:hypothetical protein